MSTTIHPAPFLKTALLADALVSGAVAALQLLGGERLAGALSLPPALLLESGVFMLGYVVLLLGMAWSQRLWPWLVRVVVVGNVGWAIGCCVLLVLLPTSPDVLGAGFLLVQAAAVLVFAALQWTGLRRSPPAAARLGALQS